MFKRKIVEEVKRLVWRMNAANPAGAYVTPVGRPTSERAEPLEVFERGCRASSFDLSDGADVLETDLDTLPGVWSADFIKATP